MGSFSGLCSPVMGRAKASASKWLRLVNPLKRSVRSTMANKLRFNTRTHPRSVGRSFAKGNPGSQEVRLCFLFAETALTLSSSVIPAGAYSLYVIPKKQDWTLVVNRSTGNKYDEKQDLLRASMQIGQIDNPVQRFQVAIAHIGPKQCNLRLYYEKAGAWAEFREE